MKMQKAIPAYIYQKENGDKIVVTDKDMLREVDENDLEETILFLSLEEVKDMYLEIDMLGLDEDEEDDDYF